MAILFCSVEQGVVVVLAVSHPLGQQWRLSAESFPIDWLYFFFTEAALRSMRPGQSMRVRKRKTTIVMNLGGARFAGETVRRS